MDIFQTSIYKGGPATDLLFITGRMGTSTSSLGEAGWQLEVEEGAEGGTKGHQDFSAAPTNNNLMNPTNHF